MKCRWAVVAAEQRASITAQEAVPQVAVDGLAQHQQGEVLHDRASSVVLGTERHELSVACTELPLPTVAAA